ncbi:MAG: hypothetical protein N4A65_01250 [Cohaesibacter sp.]|jgi:hypothetical protein|nr:hypothetical protein [Cohaesibacter sp.]
MKPVEEEKQQWCEDITIAPVNAHLECEWLEEGSLRTGILLNYRPTDLGTRKWSEVDWGWQEIPPTRQSNGKIIKIEPVLWRPLPGGRSKPRRY